MGGRDRSWRVQTLLRAKVKKNQELKKLTRATRDRESDKMGDRRATMAVGCISGPANKTAALDMTEQEHEIIGEYEKLLAGLNEVSFIFD